MLKPCFGSLILVQLLRKLSKVTASQKWRPHRMELKMCHLVHWRGVQSNFYLCTTILFMFTTQADIQVHPLWVATILVSDNDLREIHQGSRYSIAKPPKHELYHLKFTSREIWTSALVVTNAAILYINFRNWQTVPCDFPKHYKWVWMQYFVF